MDISPTTHRVSVTRGPFAVASVRWHSHRVQDVPRVQPVHHQLILAHLPVAKGEGPFGEAGDIGLVRHHEDRQAAEVQPLKNFHDLDRGPAVEVARRFVSDQNGRVVDQRARDDRGAARCRQFVFRRCAT